MSYTSRDRDRGRRAVAAVTGVGRRRRPHRHRLADGGRRVRLRAQQAAPTGADQTAAAPTTEPRPATTPTGRRQRPYVTRVTLRYVTAAAAPSPPGSGRSPHEAAPTARLLVLGLLGPLGSSGVVRTGAGRRARPGPPAPPAPSSGS